VENGLKIGLSARAGKATAKGNGLQHPYFMSKEMANFQ
jgi:hypothetical protein